MRTNQRSAGEAQEGAHDAGGVQGQPQMGKEQRGAEHDAVYELAPPRTIQVASCTYSTEEAEQISLLRQERWALLAHFHEKAGHQYYSRTTEYKNHQVRLDQVSAELYMLTKNPIYDVDGKGRLFAAELQQS